MKRRKKRSREEWDELVGGQKQSGLTARAFCRREGIGLASFYRWRHRAAVLSLAGGTGLDGAFIDMGPIGSSGVSTSAEVSPWIISLDLGEGLKLTIQRG